LMGCLVGQACESANVGNRVAKQSNCLRREDLVD
jgi:hypothetical protein